MLVPRCMYIVWCYGGQGTNLHQQNTLLLSLLWALESCGELWEACCFTNEVTAGSPITIAGRCLYDSVYQ